MAKHYADSVEKWELNDLSPLSALSQLRTLFCSSTEVSDLSPLAGLSQLQTLFCYSTQVSDLSPLAGLSQLQILECSATRVSDLSPLAGLYQLQALYCSITRVSDLSPLSALSQLQMLDCSITQVSDLSPLAGLSQLQMLDCSRTQVSDLYPLAALSQLRMLDCSDTQVSDLSPLLPLIKKGVPVKWAKYEIGGILVEDCSLTNPPREIVEQGNEAILNYFAEKERSGTEKSLEAKVVLIGEGQAGKTSLLTRLLRPGTALPNKKDRTKGLDIEIEKYVYEIPGGEQMRLNVFDFGGQDHYKPLHHFFYSKNTLYVMVSLNGDAATNDFDYWLDTAQLFGQNSPLLLVHNLFGDVRSKFSRAKYERFGEIIKDSLDVNLGDFADRRWDEVKSGIEYYASRLPHVHEEIPKSWANVRRALLARREEQVIDMEDYLALCALPENGGMDEARALRCSAYLHDIGIILHYQQDSDLREYVIVKNEWATDAAYRVIDDAEIAERQGLFYQKTDLPRIWCQPEYRKMRLQLLQLMKHFRLCYPLKADGEFIAPQLLPPNPPEGYCWQPEQDLTMYFEYDFMPLGLMSQLIVECHLLIAEERRLVWRDGAVLELTGGDARAEVLLQKRNGKQTIGIRAQGRKRRDLMTIVNGKMDELHKPFGAGLKVEKKIPCVCTRCEKVEDKWYFNLSELETRLSVQRKTIECGYPPNFEMVSIHALLGNVFSEKSDIDRIIIEGDSHVKTFPFSSKIPTVFTAFANPKNDLQSLKKEQNEIKDALQTLLADGKINYTDRADIGKEQYFDYLLNWQNRISLFHYAGHANHKGLSLQDIHADFGPLADELVSRNEESLCVVVLNGCSTQAHVQGLLEKGVKAVIATSSSVDDALATKFAIRFYKNLAKGDTLKDAYKSAANFAKTGNDEKRFQHWGKILRDTGFDDTNPADEFPWGLYISDDERVLQYTLCGGMPH